MKFGADLKNSIVPEWEHGYISYDELKRLIKELTSLEGSAKESAQEDFFMMLEDELEKVNRFYLEKIGEFDVELRKLESRPRSDSNSALAASASTNENMVALHAQIGQLQAFVWLNTQGFEKIMKKYDKFMGLRHTDGAKAPDFEARLRGEVFKSERLDACLEKFKATRSSLSSDVGALEMKLISGSANKPLAEEISARLEARDKQSAAAAPAKASRKRVRFAKACEDTKGEHWRDAEEGLGLVQAQHTRGGRGA